MTASPNLPLDDGAGVFKQTAANTLARCYAAAIPAPGQFYSGLSARDIASLCLERAGENARDLKHAQLVTRAMQTSSDFQGILAIAVGMALRSGFLAVEATWPHIAAVGSVPNFKAHERPQVGGFGGFSSTPEGAEHTARPVTEDRTELRVSTYGRQIRISRQTLINDNLAMELDLARRLGIAAARQVNVGAYALLTSGASNNGPVMTDTGQLFNATAVTTAGGHANLAGSGGAISATTLATGKAAMRRQNDRGSTEPLGIRPRTLLVPEALAEVAWAQAGIATWGTSGAVDAALAAAGRLQVVTEPALDAVSATGWYLAADPNVAPLLEVAFLNGQREPFVDEAIDFDHDAVLFKARLDFGFAARDFRAGYRNAGA